MSAVLAMLRGALLGLLGLADVDERLTAVEDDLDCDKEGSVAQAMAEAQSEVTGLRARMDEWEPGRAADEMYEKPS